MPRGASFAFTKTPDPFDEYDHQMEALLSLIAAKTGLPIIVTENGIATGNDRHRRTFLHEHALIVGHYLDAGMPIEGYFYWSLLDNFEWLEGFRPRFGLFEVDYATFARRRRPSADLFASLGRSLTRRASERRDSGERQSISRT